MVGVCARGALAGPAAARSDVPALPSPCGAAARGPQGTRALPWELFSPAHAREGMARGCSVAEGRRGDVTGRRRGVLAF